MARRTAEQYLTEIHQLLYPEEWMTEEARKAGVESGYLNGEGVREWRGAEDLDVIAEILNVACHAGVINPTEEAGA